MGNWMSWSPVTKGCRSWRVTAPVVSPRRKCTCATLAPTTSISETSTAMGAPTSRSAPELISHPGQGLMTLLLSMGDGMFAEPAHFVTGTHGKATALDFNGDGLKDLLMTAPALSSPQPITGFIVVRGDRQKGLAALRLQPVNVVA